MSASANELEEIAAVQQAIVDDFTVLLDSCLCCSHSIQAFTSSTQNSKSARIVIKAVIRMNGSPKFRPGLF